MKFLSDLFAVVLSIFAAIIVGVWLSYIEEARQSAGQWQQTCDDNQRSMQR